MGTGAEDVGKTALDIGTIGASNMVTWSRKAKREQKRYSSEQSLIQGREEADALAAKKKLSDKIRKGYMSGIIGGARSLKKGTDKTVYGNREKLG